MTNNGYLEVWKHIKILKTNKLIPIIKQYMDVDLKVYQLLTQKYCTVSNNL